MYKKNKKIHATKTLGVTEIMDKRAEHATGGQIGFESKNAMVAFARHRLISNSSAISTISHLIFSDGSRQKEFAGN